eukprot:TRINITY_DN3950_c0_g1_i7.p1 TRINITY_DN3950_c0_g1~~TRINITY_DN3950_c0_g1_i7.p1  ORF type:complete len:236 (-),score=15.87 TRINITY_DN3950_c0_g1_i7:327-1034(-)
MRRRLPEPEQRKFDVEAFKARRRSLAMPNLLNLKENGIVLPALPNRKTLRKTETYVPELVSPKHTERQSKYGKFPMLFSSRMGLSPRAGSFPDFTLASPLFAQQRPRDVMTIKELASALKENEVTSPQNVGSDGGWPSNRAIPDLSQLHLPEVQRRARKHRRVATELGEHALEGVPMPMPAPIRISPREVKFDVAKHIHNMHYANQRAVQTYIIDELTSMQARVERVLSEIASDL